MPRRKTPAVNRQRKQARPGPGKQGRERAGTALRLVGRRLGKRRGRLGADARPKRPLRGVSDTTRVPHGPLHPFGHSVNIHLKRHAVGKRAGARARVRAGAGYGGSEKAGARKVDSAADGELKRSVGGFSVADPRYARGAALFFARARPKRHSGSWNAGIPLYSVLKRMVSGMGDDD